ncbi:MAG: hypothetical protein J6T70_12275 [Bacteroidales bacterium]|nr:hypothetical protein [Bacteroidales bacterium]
MNKKILFEGFDKKQSKPSQINLREIGDYIVEYEHPNYICIQDSLILESSTNWLLIDYDDPDVSLFIKSLRL